MASYLIIGASSGIGLETARQLKSEGHVVYGTYRSHEPEEGLFDKMYHWSHSDSIPDVSDLPDTLHGLVYCPGNIKLLPFARIQPDVWVSDYELQVLGAVRWIQTVLPRLKVSGGASIVLYSTVAVGVGMNFHSLVGASKGAVEGLVRSLAAELAPTMRVNSIAPSLTDTPLAASLLNTEEKKSAAAQRHALKRVGRPQDIAALTSFLLSDKASWITGQVIGVDGGMSSIK